MTQELEAVNFSQLWYLSGERHNSVLIEADQNARPTDPGDITKGKIPPPAPLRFRVIRGRACYAQVVTSSLLLFIFSAEFFTVLEKAGLTGWRSYPVEISGMPRGSADNYRGLVVTGRSGPIDWARSAQATQLAIPPLVRPRPILVGMYFKDGTWDRSDVFFPANTCALVISNRAKNAFESSSLKGLEFCRLDQTINSDLTRD